MIEIEPEQNRFNVSLNKKRIGTIYMEVDGYYVFVPAARNRGFWDEHTLLAIGNKLKEMNKVWDDSIAEYFSKHANDNTEEQIDDF